MKFDHGSFQVSDFDRALDFYVKKLGCTVCVQGVNQEEQQAYAHLAIGDAKIELVQDLAHPYTIPPIKKPYCPHLCFKVEDMEKAVEMLKNNQIHIVHGPSKIPGVATWIYFSDIDNNVLEFVQWYSQSE